MKVTDTGFGSASRRCAEFAATTVIRCLWGEPDSYVMRPDLEGDALWDREHAHRFTAEEATAWIAKQWRARFLQSEDYVMEIDAAQAAGQAELFAGAR